MKRPAVEEFKRLTSLPTSVWGMADSDVVDLCDWILHLEAENARFRQGLFGGNVTRPLEDVINSANPREQK